MRIVPFCISAFATIALVLILNTSLSISGNKTPRFGYFLCPQDGFWQNAEPDNKNFSANLRFPDLEGNAEVYFDDRLVPHVFAEKERDAYFIQGYLHAKFRLWQMEFQTHAAAGRLSEIMGETSGTTNFVKIDKFFRRLGMVYGAEQSLQELENNPITKEETDSYTAGVNAYILALHPNQYPFEYKLLNYTPEPWSNLKTQLFLKYMSYDLAGGDWDFEMSNAKSIFTDAEIDQLYPTTQDSLDPIVPRRTEYVKPTVNVIKPSIADSIYFTATNKEDKRSFSMRPDKSNGSNNWAVSGSKTQSGAPILCNDPHLGLNLPSLWYEMQISTPTFNTYGVSFPGAPSIIIGFNDSIVWGVTNAGRDVKDYYEIQFRDSTMQEYMYDGVWTKATLRTEIIKVKDRPSITERIAITVFGPVMYDKQYPNKLNDGKYYALRWKAHDPSNELLTFNKLNHAHNYFDYIKSITTFQCPGQNFVFASRSGDIAIRQQGMFPAKWKRQGDFLMKGVDSTFNWQGYIPSKECPTMFNPERGFVSSANQLVADNNYPYYLGGEAEIYRGKIINRKLTTMSSITIDDMKKMQTDNTSIFAEMAYPVLLKYLDEKSLSADEMIYINKFKNWNFKFDVEEEGPAIFNSWWDSLEVTVYEDEFARTKLPLKWPDESTLLEGLLKDSSFQFVDDIRTSQKETVREVITTAFKKAYKDIRMADIKGTLAWGKNKDTGVRHLLRIPALSSLHLPIGGGENIINATKKDHGPSWRMIVQMSDTIKAFGVYPGGQSGNPGSKFYDNFINYWVAGTYYPLLFVKQSEVTASKQMKWKMTFSKD